jgi:hypothetical protein
VSGELDLGLVATRAWEDAGVASLVALTTPFLITDEALVDDVVGGPIADELMSGLNKVGVVGLALIPEGLRHPFAFDTPLLVRTTTEARSSPHPDRRPQGRCSPRPARRPTRTPRRRTSTLGRTPRTLATDTAGS